MPRNYRLGRWEEDGIPLAKQKWKSIHPGPLPAPILFMIDRALHAFGTDQEARQKWNLLPPIERGCVKGKLQGDGFAYHPVDICCADTTAFTLYQTGVYDPQPCFHGCVYWDPDTYKLAKQVGKRLRSSKDVWDEHKNFIDTWLPGDYLLHFDETGFNDHINTYIGDFVRDYAGTGVPEAKQDVTVYSIINGAIHRADPYGNPGDIHAEMMDVEMGYYLDKKGRSIKHCRLLAVERLYHDVIGLPVRAAPDAQGNRFQITVAASLDTRAPYPIGSNRTWHDGVHFHEGAGLADAHVQACGPGEIVLARLGPKEGQAADTSFLLIRHLFDPKLRTFVEMNDENRASDDYKSCYSFYLHLAPLSAYVNDDNTARPGAPRWIAALATPPRPPYEQVIPAGTRVVRLAESKSGGSWSVLPTLGVPELLNQPCGVVGAGADVSLYLSGSLETKSHGVDSSAGRQLLVPPPGGITGKAAWENKPQPARAPSARNLHYWNPKTGQAFKAPIKLVKDADLLLAVANGALVVRGDTPSGKLVEIPARAAPGIDVTTLGKYKCDIPPPPDEVEDKTTVSFGESATRLPLYTMTMGEGAKRYFPNEALWEVQAADCLSGAPVWTFAIKERAATGGSATRDRIWPELTPCVELSTSEFTAIQQRLAAEDPGHLEAVQRRLDEGLSRLYAAEISEAAGWQIDASNVVTPRADRDPTKWLVLLGAVEGKGQTRTFPNKEGSSLGLTYDPGIAFRAVEVIQNASSALYALVEVVSALPEQAKQDVPEKDLPHPLFDDLRKHQVVEVQKGKVATESGTPRSLQAEELVVSRETIGAMGKVPGKGGEAGLHLAIFSGENLVDLHGQAGGDDVARWVLLDEPGTDKLAPQDFLPRMLGRIHDSVPTIAASPEFTAVTRAAALDEGGVVKPSEWVTFCTTAYWQLARLIVAHPPEWNIDWEKAIEGFKGGDRWWGDDLKLPGIEGTPPKVYLYHPVRFIEWLSTGLDLGVSAAHKPKVRVEIPGRSAYDLPAADAPSSSASTHALRTVVGEVATEIPATIVLDGWGPTFNRLPTKIVRGEVKSLTLREPGVTLTPTGGGTVPELGTPVTLGHLAEGVALLADGNAHLKTAGVSRISFNCDVTWLRQGPTSIEIKFAGPGFVIAACALAGAEATKTALPTSVVFTLAPKPAPALFEAPSSLGVQFDVAVSEAPGLMATQMLVTVKGGDFGGGMTVASSKFSRRAITFKDAGEDVAKLQIYLAQLPSHDDYLPCYRYVGGSGTKTVEVTAAKGGTIAVDGQYDHALARALWRYIYSFVNDPSEIKTTFFSQLNPAAWPLQVKIESKPGAKVLDAGTLTREQALDPFLRSGRCSKPTEFPVVEEWLVKHIADHFRPPNIVPRTEFGAPSADLVEQRSKRFPEPALTAQWDASVTGKTVILPIADLEETVKVNIAIREVGEFQSEWFVCSLPAGSTYTITAVYGGANAPFALLQQLDKAGKRSMKVKNAAVIQLVLGYVGQGALDKAAEPTNLLSLTSESGAHLGTLQLPGVRDLDKLHGDPGRDAATVQYCLSQIPAFDQGAAPKVGFLAGAKITGVWTAGSLAAWKRFKAWAGKQPGHDCSTYPGSIAALFKVYRDNIVK